MRQGRRAGYRVWNHATRDRLTEVSLAYLRAWLDLTRLRHDGRSLRARNDRTFVERGAVLEDTPPRVCAVLGQGAHPAPALVAAALAVAPTTRTPESTAWRLLACLDPVIRRGSDAVAAVSAWAVVLAAAMNFVCLARRERLHAPLAFDRLPVVPWPHTG
jgi:hypothetical protein